MPYEYTRQRQGRDFPLRDYLMNTAVVGRKIAENAIINDEAKKSLHNRLAYYKEEAERNAAPVDGNEPPEKGRGLV